VEVNATQTVRVLPADVYDTLEFSALVYGGIGRLYWHERGDVYAAPVCIRGHAITADPTDEVRRVLDRAEIFCSDSDHAVGVINDRKGRDRSARVAFQEWCAELGIVRGES
jgi:hypothetical protein